MVHLSAFLRKNPALTHRNFRYYLATRFSIITALNMQAAIISYYVYQLTHDKLALGMIGLWEVIPAIGFSMFSGHFVDLKEKKRLITWCVLLYLLLTAYFTLLIWPGGFTSAMTPRHISWLIYGGIFLGGALRAFLSPAAFALMGMLVPRDQYPNATTWSSASWQSGAVLGPLAGGFLIALVGFNTSLVVTGCIELVGLIAVLQIPAQAILNKTREPVLKSLGEGLRFVFRTRIVLAALSLDMFAVLFGGAVALLPVFTDDILKAGEVGFGWLRAAPGIGSVMTLVALSVLPLKNKPGIKLALSIAGFGVTTIVFGLCGYFGTVPLFEFHGLSVSWGLIVAFFMLLAGGMLDAVSVVIRGTILQMYTPDHMRGRVAAVNTMFISSSNELGAMESGITAKLMGAVPAVVFGGFMTLAVVAVTWFRTPSLRNLRIDGSEPE